MSNQQDPAAASAPFDSGRSRRSNPRSGRATTSKCGETIRFEPSRIEVTEGERVRLVVTSGDGVHGVEIKKFKVNKKVPRGGDPVTIEFVASAAGEFPILCSEYCGDGHEDMKGMLVVAAKSAR